MTEVLSRRLKKAAGDVGGLMVINDVCVIPSDRALEVSNLLHEAAAATVGDEVLLADVANSHSPGNVVDKGRESYVLFEISSTLMKKIRDRLGRSSSMYTVGSQHILIGPTYDIVGRWDGREFVDKNGGRIYMGSYRVGRQISKDLLKD